LNHDRILEGVTAGRLRDVVIGREFFDTTRHGKNLFVHLDDGNHILIHFGMTGELKYYKNPREKPARSKVLFSFDTGYHCVYMNTRLLGKLSVISDIDEYLATQSLGPDILKLNPDQFIKILSERGGMIKSAFMDQSLVAGLGNIYADEVLFQAGIHPKHPVSDLDVDALRLLYNHIVNVLTTAIDCQVDSAEFPAKYLITHREPDAECPRCGGEIQRIKVSSRSTYFCPACQSN